LISNAYQKDQDYVIVEPAQHFKIGVTLLAFQILSEPHMPVIELKLISFIYLFSNSLALWSSKKKYILHSKGAHTQRYKMKQM